MSRSSSAEESCNSRHFSWLMKSCFPNPQHHHPITAPKKPLENPSISLLPDDLLLECLSRVSLSSIPSLLLVSRSWSVLVRSPSFLFLRRRHCLVTPTLFSLLNSHSPFFQTLRLGLDTSTWTIASFSSAVRIPAHARLASVGPQIYIVGRVATVRCDTWTGNVTDRSGMIYPRKKFAVGVVGGKIYVAGGAARTSTVEEYDPASDTWRVVSDAPRRRYGCIGTSAEGILYIIGGLKIGQEDGRDAHHVYTSSMDLYEVEAGAWLRSRVVPGGGCVVAACSAEGHVYILASHAVELSFWRFDGRRGVGCSFGEWRRLKSPPHMPLDNTVRFSCAGVGNKVVLIRVTRFSEHLIRRERFVEGVAMMKKALVMIYDCHGGDWSKGPDIPNVVPRPACVCVEC